MNRYDRRIAITPERISENLKHEVAAAIPLDEKIVITAVNRGVPFMLDNKTQPAGRGIFSLAEAVRSRMAALEAAPEPVLQRGFPQSAAGTRNRHGNTGGSGV